MRATLPESAQLTHTVPERLIEWLASGLPEAVPPFAFDRISGGYSMLTYRMTDSAGNAWVLRHPPAGHHSGRSRNPLREARAMSALLATPVPVPRIRLTGTVGDPLGLPCHVTDFVDGYVLDAAAATSSVSADTLRTASIGITDALAELHTVDPDEVGVGDLGPREDYLGRQLRRWSSVIAESVVVRSAGQVAELEEIAAQLWRRLPPDSGCRIVHGDYRLGNAITGDDGTIRAILDWELVTLGDPLADLGMLLAFWDPPPEAMLGVRMPTSAPGAVGVDDVVEHYVARTGADPAGIGFHRAMACWRIACTAVRTLALYESGAMPEKRDISRFADAANAWIGLARAELARA